MKKPFFSIIIPTYNRAREIGRCISSVVNQSFKEWEAIVIDNYSEDNTEDIVKSFNDDRIHYFKNHNYGVISVSRNFGLDRAIGEWICFLDSDDEWLPNKLEVIYNYVNRYDIIYHEYACNMERTHPFQNTDSHFFTVRGNTMQWLIQRGDPFSPSCTAVSREFLGDTRFSEEKRLFAIEDYDFFLMLMEKHPRTKHLKDKLTRYDVTTGVSHDNEKHRYRSRVLFSKYRPQLTRDEFRNVLKLYMILKAGDYYENEPAKSRQFFWIAASSSIWLVKKKALVYVLKTYFLQLRNCLKRKK